MIKTRFCKKIKFGKIIITAETFRIQNKFLPLPHNLFKSGINKFEDVEGNKYISFVISNFRLIIVKTNG